MIEALNCFSKFVDSDAAYLLQCFNFDQDLTSEAKPGRPGLESRLFSRSFPSELHIPKGSQPTGPDESPSTVKPTEIQIMSVLSSQQLLFCPPGLFLALTMLASVDTVSCHDYVYIK